MPGRGGIEMTYESIMIGFQASQLIILIGILILVAINRR